MARGDHRLRKATIITRIRQLCKDYQTVIIVTVENVTSGQFQDIRKKLRGRAVILLGKNTLMRFALKETIKDIPQIERLSELLRGNIGLIFTDSDIGVIRDEIATNRVRASARIGSIAQTDIVLHAGPTSVPAQRTSFFQSLDIPTKIVKQNIEVQKDVTLTRAGERIGASEVELLSLLGIQPLTYGLVMTKVYEDGDVYDASVLDVTSEMILKTLSECITNVAAASLALEYPTMASVGHTLINAFKDLAAVAIEADVKVDAVEKMMQQAATCVAAAPVAAPAEAKKEEAKVEEDEESDIGGFDMFG